MPPLQYTNRSSLHLRIYPTKLAILSFNHDVRELITLPTPDLFEPRKELNPFTSFEEILDDTDLIPLHEEELTLIQLAGALKVPKKEHFQWYYNDEEWEPFEDKQPLAKPLSRTGWTNYGTTTKPNDTLSIVTVLYRPKPLYSPALAKAIQSHSTKKRQRCLEDSSPSPQPDNPQNPPLGVSDYVLPPREGTKSCPARTTQPSRKKRKLIHSR